MLIAGLSFNPASIYSKKPESQINDSRKLNFTGINDCFIKEDNYLKPLFPNGTDNISFNQGQYNDCQFLSAVNALSKNPAGAKLLEKMITMQDGAYKITFNKFPNNPITVQKDEAASKVALSTGIPAALNVKVPRNRVEGDLGMKLLELAYAKLMKTVYPDKFKHIPDNEALSVFLDPNYHYSSGIALGDITGREVNTLIANGKNIPEESKSFLEENQNMPGLLEKTVSYLDNLAKEQDKYAITICTAGDPNNLSQGYYLDPNKEFLKCVTRST